MTLGFILNGEDVVIKCEADVRLIDILRTNYSLTEAKEGCLSGKCGFCAVLLGGKVVHACLVPAFRLRGCEVITLEAFSLTDEYRDIIAGFRQANMHTCGYCDAGKILTAGALLEKNSRPSRKEILGVFSGIKCRCTDPDKLVEGIEKAAELRQRRLYGRSN